ncbi:MAG: DNA-binding protein WhiA [Lachnospiraceae bacterium]|nr:DNA-binding protein WhiA [Lachnospiraceae bacterium]
MSFAGTVKEELFRHLGNSRHCQIAELAALISFSGSSAERIMEKEGITGDPENDLTARKCFTLLEKTFNIVKRMDEEQGRMLNQALSSPVLLQRSCCRRAYLRGAFLAAGSVSDPNKSYHFEIVCINEDQVNTLIEILKSFDITAKDIIRKNHPVVYIKEGSLIVEALNVMEAHVALMEYENSRILKDVRNSLNRRVNCETANIGKTVTAAIKQAEDIRAVMGMPEYRNLPYGIKQIADLRLQYPDASLKELGEMCDPPIGKSGVNHRLRKLSMMAEKIK